MNYDDDFWDDGNYDRIQADPGPGGASQAPAFGPTGTVKEPRG